MSSVIANPIATSTNSAGFLVTVYATATQSSSATGASTTGKESPATGTGTGTGSAATASATKNSGVRVGGMSGLGLGALVGLAVL